jgi:hypothetical protein
MTKTLRLTLKAQPFEVMSSGEKKEEYREPSEWIKSRLFHKDGTAKHYDFVEFTNGYGATRPKFKAAYVKVDMAQESKEITYSNGLVVKVKEGDYVIQFLLPEQANKVFLAAYGLATDFNN